MSAENHKTELNFVADSFVQGAIDGGIDNKLAKRIHRLISKRLRRTPKLAKKDKELADLQQQLMHKDLLTEQVLRERNELREKFNRKVWESARSLVLEIGTQNRRKIERAFKRLIDEIKKEYIVEMIMDFLRQLWDRFLEILQSFTEIPTHA